MRNLNILRSLLACAALFIALPMVTNAQQLEDGRFSGSFETNSIYYVPDKDVYHNTTPDDRIGSNNYLKLEYTNGRLIIGAQAEYYGKSLQGFNPMLDKFKVMTKYVTWRDENYSITVGDIFEQFGNGLVLRSWEDRDLGFNNSIEGARITYNYNDYFNLKALWGRPRFAMDYVDTEIRAVDLSVSLSRLLNMRKTNLAIEGSFVNRYENRSDWFTDSAGAPLLSNNMDLWSGRIVFDTDFGLSIKGEAAGKGKDPIYTTTHGTLYKHGNAQLAEISYNGNGFGITLTGRRLKYMNTSLTYDPDFMPSPLDHDYAIYNQSNMMNFLPALTRQHTYMLANIQPHQLQVEGEQGGQLDVFYNVKRGTGVGGRYGMKLHLNASAYFPIERGIKSDGSEGDYNLTYTDISLDIDKKWNRTFETILLYSFQGYNPEHGMTSKLFKAHVFVLDMLYKFNRKTSVRTELQYLYSEDDYGDFGKDWWGALVELNVAPRWSFFVSDMYNWQFNRTHDVDEKQVHIKQHYYNGGVSFTKGRVRAALSYGRHRAGFVCSGGVCRVVPAYTGANFTFTASF